MKGLIRYFLYLVLFILVFRVSFAIGNTVAYFTGCFGFWAAYYFGMNYDRYNKV